MSANYLEHFSASMLQNLQEMAGLEAEAADQFWQAGQHARRLYANAEALGHF